MTTQIEQIINNQLKYIKSNKSSSTKGQIQICIGGGIMDFI